MSLQPRPDYSTSEETRRDAHAALPVGHPIEMSVPLE